VDKMDEAEERDISQRARRGHREKSFDESFCIEKHFEIVRLSERDRGGEEAEEGKKESVSEARKGSSLQLHEANSNEMR
jgi:hypothetical protein